MMTLDEAIIHCFEVAEEQYSRSEFETDNVTYAMSDSERESCRECGDEHTQLAEWLNELKARRIKEQTARNFLDEYKLDNDYFRGFEDCLNKTRYKKNESKEVN